MADDIIREIKNRVDIVNFIGSRITLKKSGRNFKALCPFHQEKTPSFIISPERQIWHCFGACQEGGDVIKFLMKWENLTFYEAIKDFADKLGLKLKKIDFEDKTWKKKEQLIKINNLASEFFFYILTKTDFGKQALDYLSQREINQQLVKKFLIGYAPHSWDSLYRFFLKKGYQKEEINEAGLLVKGENGRFYDRFRGRLIFPIKDIRGNVIGFSGRVLDDKEGEAKYINTPETPIYHKRESLFGIDLAKEAIKNNNSVFLVEGEFDMISCYQRGIENIVAIKGSAVTKEQLMLLKRYTNRIILTLDADLAGQEAVKKGAEEAENLDFEIQVIVIDFAKDPDEAIKKDGERFKKLLKKPIPIYDYFISQAQKKYSDDDAYSKKKLAEETVVLIKKIKNPIVKSFYIKKIAEIVNLSEKSIENLIRKIEKEEKMKKRIFFNKKNSDLVNRDVLIQKYLLSLMFQSDDPFKIKEEIFKILEIDDFYFPVYQKILKIFFEFKKNDYNLKNFVEKLPEETKAVFDEIYLFATVEINFSEENFKKLIYELKRFSLKRKISQLLKEKNERNEEEIDYQLKKLIKEISQVEKKFFSL
ncbi:MAG: DNA primase [Patescibacteria group bacterium]|nr:DNA primase [Patescibacteria group bacterium]